MNVNPPVSYDFSPYLEQSMGELLARLALVQSTIAELQGAHAEAKSQELADKAQGWNLSNETSVRGKEKASQFNAVTTTQTRIETEAMLNGLREEKEFLTFLIEIKTKVEVSV